MNENKNPDPRTCSHCWHEDGSYVYSIDHGRFGVERIAVSPKQSCCKCEKSRVMIDMDKPLTPQHSVL